MDVVAARRVLGVPLGADRRRIDATFRELARRHHPDRGGDPAMLREALEAREALTRGRPPPLQVVPSERWWHALLFLLTRLLREPPPRVR
jgi:hypothetical protein